MANEITVLITDRTEEDVRAVIEASLSGSFTGDMKGAYNASDLNRVNTAINYLVGEYDELGYYIDGFTERKITWAVIEVPTSEALEEYLGWVRRIRDYIPNVIDVESFPLPETMDRINYSDANDIERVLVEVDRIIENIKKSWFFSADLWGGEITG